VTFFGRGAAEFAGALDAGTTGEPGVALALRLRSAGTALDGVVVPRPEFRDALRLRLLAVATVQAAAPATAPARPLAAAVSWRRRGSAVAAGAMASVVAVSGVAVAGSQSLPGDPFYGVKRTTEALQLRAADGDLERGTQHLEFAATRLREVRGLTLGRDAADAGPALGPSAMSGGITLSSASQPLASGDALSAPVADRVRETLAAMDEQTEDGTALLNEAYRSSRSAEPLRVLSRFADRQSAGLAQLIPALPPATQDRARSSLALLDDVSESTEELLSIGTCGLGCDPSQAAPTLPSTPGSGPTSTTGSAAPCDCAAPAPAPAPGPSAPATSPSEPGGSGAPQPEPTRGPTPDPSPPAPSPSPSSGGLPVPVPSLPVPLPPLPVPVPTLTLPPLPPALDPLVPELRSSSTGSAPLAPTPLPQLPLAPRP
jgi:hypothetical protein